MADPAAGRARPPVYDYDPSVPAPVIGRWNRLDQDRAVLTDLALPLVAVGTIVIGLTAGVSMAVGVPFGPAGLVVLVCAAILLGGRSCRARLVRGGRLLPSKVMHQLITNRLEVSFPPARTFCEETELVARAAAIAADLVASPAWHSVTLESHPDQLDPLEEARQMYVAAVRLRQFRGQL
jgi:hypothetical protein